MPIYEYHCDGCGTDFEQMQKISDKPARTCPQCKGHKVHRVISQTSFVLKGSGWYVTDYARGGTGSPGSESKGKKDKPAAGGGSKSDSGASEKAGDSSKGASSESEKTTATATA